MNREGKKCVLYPRVSTEMQVDGYSLEGQKNSLKRFADREEMEIVGIYEDAGKSGKSIEGRPAFKKMLSDIKNGLEIDYILVYKLSRFGRSLLHARSTVQAPLRLLFFRLPAHRQDRDYSLYGGLKSESFAQFPGFFQQSDLISLLLPSLSDPHNMLRP